MTSPDFKHWSRMPYWTEKEAIALSFGVSPYEDIESDMRSQQADGQQRANEFMNRLVSCRRARTSGYFGPPSAHLTPAAFLKWAKSMEFDCPEELGLAVAMWDKAKTAPKDRGSDETRKINTRNMVIAAWARSLDFDPDRHTDAIGKLLKIIQVNGGAISDTALRDIVKEGREYLDTD